MQILLLEKHSSQVSQILLDRQSRYYTHTDGEGQVRFTENPLPDASAKKLPPSLPSQDFLGFGGAGTGQLDGPAHNANMEFRHWFTLVL